MNKKLIQGKLQRGFTLIELLIAVAIVGILLTVAYPSYQDSVRRSEEAIAQASLIALSTAMEQYYAEHSSYSTSFGAMAYPDKVYTNGGNHIYTLTISGGGESFVLRATPTTSGYLIYEITDQSVKASGLVVPFTTANGW